jgi:hypothetical protein
MANFGYLANFFCANFARTKMAKNVLAAKGLSPAERRKERKRKAVSRMQKWRKGTRSAARRSAAQKAVRRAQYEFTPFKDEPVERDMQLLLKQVPVAAFRSPSERNCGETVYYVRPEPSPIWREGKIQRVVQRRGAARGRCWVWFAQRRCAARRSTVQLVDSKYVTLPCSDICLSRGQIVAARVYVLRCTKCKRVYVGKSTFPKPITSATPVLLGRRIAQTACTDG